MVFNLHGEISNDQNFMLNLIDSISWASKGETIDINISTFGGDVMLGMPLGEALARHEGLIRMTVDGICGSMGAFLLTYCDEAVATEGASFMFHKAFNPSEDADAGAKKIVDIVNKNFRKRMEAKGMDPALIEAIFDKDEEVYLDAFEAKAMGVISNVVKNVRKNGKPMEMVLANFRKNLNKITFKMSKPKKHFVTLALVKADGGRLLTAFETPDGVIEEGTQLVPLNGEEIGAGDYTFEGNTISVDENGKVTKVVEAPEETAEEIAARKAADAKKDEAVTTEAVETMVNTAVTSAVEAGMTKMENTLKEALKAVGSDHKIEATFNRTPKDDKPVSARVQAKKAEDVVRARVNKRNKVKA